MQHFDTDYAEHLCKRIESIPADKAPLWGRMHRDELVEHFVWTLRHVMGRSSTVPDCSTRFSRRVLKPLVLKGCIAIPKNIRLPEQLSRQGIQMRDPGDMETLQALVEEYLRRVQDDDLRPCPHPFFGPLGIDEWDRMHVVHFEHHLRQFSA